MKELPNGAMKSTPTPTRRRRRRRRSMRRRRPTSGTLIRRPIHLVSFLIAIHLDILIFILVWVWFVFYNLKKKQLLNLEMSCTGFLPSWLCWLTKASDWLFSFWPFFYWVVKSDFESSTQIKSTILSTSRRPSRRRGNQASRRRRWRRVIHSVLDWLIHSFPSQGIPTAICQPNYTFLKASINNLSLWCSATLINLT